MKRINLVVLFLMAGLMAGPVFAKHDNGNNNRLPPGLQKKQARGEPLPPGWQKKLAKGEVMDIDVYRQSQVVVPVDSHGLLTVRIEGKLVKLYKDTKEIVEILE